MGHPAPAVRRLILIVVAALAIVALALALRISGNATADTRLPRSILGLELPPSMLRHVTASQLRGYRRARVTALVLRHAPARPVRSAARRVRLPVLVEGHGALGHAGSVSAARARANAGGGHAVAVHLNGPATAVKTRLPRRGRLVAVVRLNPHRRFDTARWRAAIARARASAHLDLVAALTSGGAAGRRAVAAFTRLLTSTHSTAPTTSPSNLPPPTVFVAPSGSDRATCRSPAAACASLDRAYRVASPGEVVQVAGGTYPRQDVQEDTSKINAGSDVTFLPAPGETVTIDGDLHVWGSHVSFHSLHLHNIYSEANDTATSSNHVSYVNIDGAGFQIGSVHDVTIRGGDWGPNRDCTSGRAQEPNISPSLPDTVPTNITLDGLLIHDQSSADLQTCHMGGMTLVAASNVVIRNTTFLRDVVYDIEVGDFSHHYGNPTHVTLENDVFGAPVQPDGTTNDTQKELQFSESGVYSDWLIRFNSFVNGIGLNFDHTGSYQGIRVIGNVAGDADCGLSGVTYGYNLLAGAKCAATDRSTPRLPFLGASPATQNLRPQSGFAGRDLVTPTSSDYSLGTDHDGTHRPQGRARDAGAYELK